MALDASKKIKGLFGETVKFEEFTVDSPEGKAFNVTSSTNVFVNDQLLPVSIWSDQEEFQNYIQKIVGEKPEIKRCVSAHKGYEVAIIGGGPAGLTAGIYCARARLKTILIEAERLGGQIALTDKVENYPGFFEVSGKQLIENMEKQARRFGLEIETHKKVNRLTLEGAVKKVYAGSDVYSCKSIILTGGLTRAKLGISREAEFTGRGVSYCAVCDANFFKGRKVGVVGGGDSAIEDAIYLSRFASQVIIIHWLPELQAIGMLQEMALNNPKICILWEYVIQELVGNTKLEGVIVRDLNTGQTQELELDGLFIAIGSHPDADFLGGLVVTDEYGYVMVDEKMETSVQGIFAAGDMRATPLRQVATAVGDGAIAAISAERYLSEKGQELPEKCAAVR
ncbi:MAG TPA: thioredoxin-disulfide reductase [Thermodesulfobacteriota bacterium]|nr:thioredoxin-disulfide reductase [Thermodesulfobacteriota bacterium]